MKKRAGIPCDVCGEPTWVKPSTGKKSARHRACAQREREGAERGAEPRRLRVVGDDEKPAKRSRPMSIEEAAEAGDQRELLVAMRRRVAKTIADPNCPPRDLAALTRRLQEIGREIEALDAKARQEAEEDGGSTPDEDWDAEAI